MPFFGHLGLNFDKYPRVHQSNQSIWDSVLAALQPWFPIKQSQIQSVQWSLAAQGRFTSSFFDWLRRYCFTSTERCSHVVSWKYRYPVSTTSPRESWDWLAGKKGQQTLEILRYLRFLSDFLKRFRSDLVLMFQIGECDSWVILREFDWFLSDLWFVIFE